jgi:hypothetical protein
VRKNWIIAVISIALTIALISCSSDKLFEGQEIFVGIDF